MDHYQVLGIAQSASQEDIIIAYRRMALLWHPDRNRGRRDAEERMKQINVAYEILGDPVNRRKYDQILDTDQPYDVSQAQRDAAYWQRTSAPSTKARSRGGERRQEADFQQQMDRQRLLWTFLSLHSQLSSAVTYDGSIYVASRDSKSAYLYGLRADSGERIWTHELTNFSEYSPSFHDGVVCSDGFVYYVSPGHIEALDATNGESVWVYRAKGLIECSPLVSDGNIYVGAATGLEAIDMATGNNMWHYGGDNWWKSNGPVRYTPSISSNLLYGVTTIHSENMKSLLCAIDIHSGKPVWKYEYKTEANSPVGHQGVGVKDWSSPLLEDGRLHAASGDGRIYTLDAFSGDVLWTYDTKKQKYVEWTSPIASNGILYVVAHDIVKRDCELHALKASDGTLIWSYRIPNSRFTSWSGEFHAPTVSAEILFGLFKRGATSNSSGLYACDAQTGKLLWVYESSDQVLSPISVSDGVVYLTTRESLQAVDASTGKIKWQWFHEGNPASSPSVHGGTLYLSTTVASELGPNLTDQRIYAIDIRDADLKPGVSNGQL